MPLIIFTKEEVLQRLALISSQKGMSLSCLNQVAKLIKDMGYDIPTDIGLYSENK